MEKILRHFRGWTEYSLAVNNRGLPPIHFFSFTDLPSGRSWFSPEQKHFNSVSSGEKQVWPEEKRLNDVSSTETAIWPDGRRSETLSFASCVNKFATSRQT